MNLPPVILVPGLLCDKTVWQQIASKLRETRDVLIADLSQQDDIRQMAADQLVSVDGEIHVAGHSMGARVALEMAYQAPARVTRLALLDTGMHPLKVDEPEKRQKAVDFAFEFGMDALADRWLPPMVHPDRHKDEALMNSLRHMVLSQSPDLHARQIRALVNRPDATGYVSDITCPTLLIVGRQDIWSPLKQHQEMADKIPNAVLKIVENAGHFAPVERPEIVARMLCDWFNLPCGQRG